MSAIPCETCGMPATCWGSYEGAERPSAACDECCSHGNEDGRCSPLDIDPTDPEPR
jgi:hypothetical protein